MSKKKGEIREFKSEQDNIKKKKKNVSSRILILVIIVALVYFVMSGIKIIRLNQEHEAAQIKYAELLKEKEDLQAEYENISSSQYMERLARRDLKLVKANELLFVLPEKIDKADKDDGAAEEE